MVKCCWIWVRIDMKKHLISLRVCLLGVFIGCCGMTSAAQANEWQEASKVVVQTTDTMLSILDDAGEQSLVEVVPAIDEVLSPVVDFRVIAKGVMAKYYRRAKPEQFEAFVVVFHKSLVNTYAKAIVAFDVGSYDLQTNPGVDKRKGREKIWVKVYAGSSVYDIHYTMSAKSGPWKVTNVVLDGVNLGLAFRNQFAAAMRENGNDMDAVIANWNQSSS